MGTAKVRIGKETKVLEGVDRVSIPQAYPFPQFYNHCGELGGYCCDEHKEQKSGCQRLYVCAWITVPADYPTVTLVDGSFIVVDEILEVFNDKGELMAV